MEIKLRNDMYIGEQITIDDMKNWKSGSIITIEAGTGKGKSEFIKNNLYIKAKVEGRRILFLVHRDNCYEQFKQEIKGKEDIIKLMTYQTIDTICSSGEKFNFSNYHYIVSDEFHYFTADSSFNNKTDYSLEAILAETRKTRIFMSATANLMTKYLQNYRKLELISYKSDLDFSFIDKLYFNENDNVEEALIDEIIEKGDKAIVFVNNIKKLERLHLKYKDISLFNCSKSDGKYKLVDEDKINKMLYEQKFEEKLLFTTSVMDTGVSIKDTQVKHIIVNNILDINVLIQCIGRKRMIDENDKVNIYIKNVNNMSLNGHIKTINDKLDRVDYFEENGQDAYIYKVEREYEDKSILYYKIENGETVVKKNDMPYFKALLDKLSYTEMLNQGYKQYISNLLQIKFETIDVIIEKQTLEECLDSIVGFEMFIDDSSREEFIEIVGLRNRNNRLVRDFKTIASHIEKEFNKKYILITKTSYKKGTYRKKYWKVICTE